MQIDDLKKLKIAILGFGHEGQAVFSYLKNHSIEATVLDESTGGSTYLDNLSDFDLVFRSPGIPRLSPKILKAEQNGLIITSQTKWFFEHCRAKIIGVTGTKGKGTTCSLIYETLKSSGKNVYLTGNIGKIAPLEFLDNLTGDEIVVFELSSFQLQDLTISPHIGVCLMVTSDHLNHHKDLIEYHNAKAAITEFQRSSDFAIYNTDYEASKVIGLKGDGQKLTISKQKKPNTGALIENQSITITGLKNNDTYDLSTRKLRGDHNLENIAASILVSSVLKISPDIILKTCLSFKGLEHRLQFVGNFNGVDYYNDSISTVPETAIAAIKSFTEPIHLILGGSEKGLDYHNLIETIGNTKNIKTITLLGEVGLKLKKEFDLISKKNFEVSSVFTDFKDAINYIKSKADSGDICLLSPASASFDMFKNYAERGDQFVKLVSEL